MEASTAVSIISAIVAFAAAIISVYFSRRSLRYTELQLLLQHYDRQRVWASETTAALAAAVHMCDLTRQAWSDSQFSRHRWEILCKLSALADQGRWFFANEAHDKVGTGKEVAYRGLRPAVLDCIVDAYRLLWDLDQGKTEPNASTREALKKQQRAFVSEIQQVLDPRSQETEFLRIARRKVWHPS